MADTGFRFSRAMAGRAPPSGGPSVPGIRLNPLARLNQDWDTPPSVQHANPVPAGTPSSVQRPTLANPVSVRRPTLANPVSVRRSTLPNPVERLNLTNPNWGLLNTPSNESVNPQFANNTISADLVENTAECPADKYTPKNKICPFRYRTRDGCPYRTHDQNYLTKHVRRMHDGAYRENYRRRRQVPARPVTETSAAQASPLRAALNESRDLQRLVGVRAHDTLNESRDLQRPVNVRAHDRQTQTDPVPIGMANLTTPSLTRVAPSIDNPISDREASALQSTSGSSPNALPTSLSTPDGSRGARGTDNSGVRELTPAYIRNNESTLVDVTDPVSTSTPRRPALQQVNMRTMPISIQFDENFSMLVSGPSKCGKTYFVSSLLNNLETVCVRPPSKVIWVYTNAQAAHTALTPFVTQFIDVQSFRDSGEDEIQTYLLKTMKDLTGPDGHGLLIFDDCQLKPVMVKVIASLFSGTGRHNNISLIYICQQLFDKDDQKRISTNANYMTIFPSARYRNQARILNDQFFSGGHPGIIDAMFAALGDKEYLLFNLTTRDLRHVIVLTGLFAQDHIVKVFVPSFSDFLHHDG